jgi:4-hydroxybenzoate polyprenyltransferase
MQSTQNAAVSPFSRVKLFLALSRTLHGLLDMAAPVLGALLWLGGIPSLKVSLVGGVTVFAGYTAVYALNDVVDHRIDRHKMGLTQETGDEGTYLDSALLRHPIAQNALSLRQGVVWTSGWAVLAVAGAWVLNPWCVAIFVGASLLEVVYCLLFRVSAFRSLVSGGVKTSGPVAAVFAVDPAPSPAFLIVLFLCLFCWEIGGQNIPADWIDREKDRAIGARTLPVAFGPRAASLASLATLAGALVLSLLLMHLSPVPAPLAFLILVAASGVYLLLAPACRAASTGGLPRIMNLFNRASLWPLTLLILVLVQVLVFA